jgi:hypothetical protein
MLLPLLPNDFRIKHDKPYTGRSTSMITVKRNAGFEGKSAAAIDVGLEACSNTAGMLGDTILYLFGTTNSALETPVPWLGFYGKHKQDPTDNHLLNFSTSCRCSSQSQVTTTLTLEASTVRSSFSNIQWLCLRLTEHNSACAYKLASPSCLLPTSSMAPKSHSAKPALGSKAKLTSPATKMKEGLLKSRKSG